MPEVPLERCPLCRYALRGLPREYRCPECGFLYDAQTRVWRAFPSRMIYVGAVTWSIFLLICGSGIVRGLIAGVLPDLWITALVALAITFLIRSLYDIRTTERKGRCVAVSPAGVFVRTLETERLFLWDDIVKIERFDHGVKERKDECLVRIIVRVKAKSQPFPVVVGRIFATETERAAFLEAVAQRRGETGDAVSATSDATPTRARD